MSSPIEPGLITVDYDPAGGLTLICNHTSCGHVVAEYVDGGVRDIGPASSADLARVIVDAERHVREHR